MRFLAFLFFLLLAAALPPAGHRRSSQRVRHPLVRVLRTPQGPRLVRPVAPAARRR